MEIIIIDNDEYYYDTETDKIISKLDDNESLDDDLIKPEEKLKLEKAIQYQNDFNNVFNIDYWEKKLRRSLTFKEKKLFHKVFNEQESNNKIKGLQYNLMKNNCYILRKTNNIGNCLFESLAEFGLGDNNIGIPPVDMIRKSVATILLVMKNELYFFPSIELTLEELFNNSNDIELVKDNKKNEIYIYDYNAMIIDLLSKNTWNRLPTELILMTISRIYEVELLIYHNKSSYVNKINVFSNMICSDQNIQTIRLGQINEEHYFPVAKIPDELKDVPDIVHEHLNNIIEYDYYSNKFIDWTNNIVKNDGKKKDVIMNTINKTDEETINDYVQISSLDDFDII
jgi:hypothetical protein